MKTIDINGDLGESFGAWHMGDDAAMLPLISSANVACGFHAGSPANLLDTLRLCATHRVTVGAHVSYPDLAGFGRRAMAVPRRDLIADILYQIGALRGLAKAAGCEVRYIKPHGALYNAIAHDVDQGQAVIDAINAEGSQLPLVALAGSPLVALAQSQGIRVIAEAFADRGYRADGTLVPRSEPDAVLHRPQDAVARALELVNQGGIPCHEGRFIPLKADTLCVHGDTPGAVAMAAAIRHALEQQGIAIASFI